MDWNAAIERHRDTLKRILAALVAMAGLGDGRATLPRHLHRAVMRLLRPAEAAARRLIIVAARGLVVKLPPLRPRKAKPGQTILRNGVGTGILMPPGAGPSAQAAPAPAAPLSLPLLDPLPRWGGGRRRPVPAGVPRISVPGFSVPFPIAPPPSSNDPVDAARLGRRLAALALVLDDLPGQARRFARWRARCDARAETSRLVSPQKNPARPAVSPGLAAAPRFSARQPPAAGS